MATQAVSERASALRRIRGRQGLAYAVRVVGVALLYYATARIGYQFEFAGPVAAIVWLPVGVGISCLYLGGLGLWPGVFLGDVLVNDYIAIPLGSALGQTCGNTLEAVAATLIMRRLLRDESPLDSLRGLGVMVIAMISAAALSATVGALSLLAGDVISTHDLLTVWRTWVLGDASGALVVFPLAIAWYKRPLRGRTAGRVVEGVLLLAVLALLSEIAFHQDSPLAYLAFPGLVWAALRFGQRGATLAIAATVAVAVWNTVHYVGPFAYEDISRSVLSTQLFIAVAALSCLCLAAVVKERERYADGLVASRARIVELADIERRRLERNLHDGAQQRLTALAVHLQLAEERVREEPAVAGELFSEAGGELGRAIAELRDLAHGIHPSVLTDFGLAGAMESAARRSPVPITLLELPSTRLDPAVEATAYYVFAEALANAQKHAHPSTIRVRAAVHRGVLHIQVVDDGAGGASESAGLGLRGLRDRLESLHGTFSVSSGPSGRGTRIYAGIPTGMTDGRAPVLHLPPPTWH